MDKIVDKDGTFVNFSGGTAFIDEAVNNLTAGNNIDIKGVSGELDFDTSTGDVRSRYLGYEPFAVGGDVDSPSFQPVRVYLLNDAPATDGTWFDL